MRPLSSGSRRPAAWRTSRIIARFCSTARCGGAGWQTISVPFGDALLPIDLEAGTWRADVDGTHGELWVRRGALEGGRVDRVVHVPPELADPASIDAFVDGAFPIAELERGEVEIVEVETTPDVLGVDAAHRLLAGGSGEPGWPKIDVFLVASIAASGLTAGGFCSLVGFPESGTSHSCVLVVLEPGEPPSSRTLAHELGHFFGLFHTSDEQVGADAILDTPVCAPETLEHHASACPDRDNLMFRTGGTQSLSSVQARIVRRSVAYRAAE